MDATEASERLDASESSSSERQERLVGSVVTVGVFDGVHLGHQELVRRAVSSALTLGLAPVAYTFDPHPACVLAPHVAPKLLMSVEERCQRLRGLGVEEVYVARFDRAFAEMTAKEWVQTELVDRFLPRRVVVGFNFTYGRDRAGNTEHLAGSGSSLGFSVDAVEPVTFHDQPISSTRIRSFVAQGRVEEAASMLGRTFSVRGTVVHGAQRGRGLGFPTANLHTAGEVWPAPGVYATWARVHRGPGTSEPFSRSVTNIGVRPTFDSGPLCLECHLLDVDQDLYGQQLEVAFVGRVRAEKKFADVADLEAQIRRDIETAKRLLENTDNVK
jgi:riboflavin kinase / FMN adenylyltransferase